LLEFIFLWVKIENMKKFIFTSLFFFFVSSAFSQELEIGISYYNRGEYDKCFEKMKEVLDKREDSTAYRYLALCAVKGKRCDTAIPYIEKWKAQKKPEAFYYSGICSVEMGENEKAISDFKRALNAPYPVNEYAVLFLGELYLKTGDKMAGRKYLKMAQKAENADVRERAIALLKKEKVFSYKVDFTSGYNYDSNAGLLPDDPVLRALFKELFVKKSDNRWFGNFKGEIVLNPFSRFYSAMSYNFYQNLNHRFHHINFQTHRAEIEGRYEIKKHLIWFISGGYSKAYISTDLNSFSEGGYGKTGLLYRFDSSELGGFISLSKTAYYERLSEEQDRDGWFERMELYSRQRILSGFSLYEGYSIENSNTCGRDWDYISHTISIKGILAPFEKFTVSLEPFYTYRDFRYKDSIFGKERVDNEIGIEAFVGYSILRWLNVFASYGFYLENSNIKMYDYKRQIVGAGISLRVE
jgi:tetratricopeptide (TPR) repeat protein